MNTVDNAGQIDHDQLFNATANGVVVTNSDGTILKVNNNARQIFGVKDHTLIGSSAYISLPLIGKVIHKVSIFGFRTISDEILQQSEEFIFPLYSRSHII